jgi:protein gp37
VAEHTEISWAHSTFNPWIGCTKVGPGCDHCYAERDMATRRKVVTWGPGEARKVTSEAYWKEPHKWNRKAAASGEPWRVFCASLADVFDKDAPPEVQARLWRLIEDTPHLKWMLLSKRIGRWIECVPVHWRHSFPANVWMGATVVNQEEHDRDVPKLLTVPCDVLWLSIEPQLGEIVLRPDWLYGGRRIGWVITGGESGPHARPYVLGWAKALVRQCEAAGVPIHVKQMGANPTNREGQPHPQKHFKGGDPSEWPEVLRRREFPRDVHHQGKENGR